MVVPTITSSTSSSSSSTTSTTTGRLLSVLLVTTSLVNALATDQQDQKEYQYQQHNQQRDLQENEGQGNNQDGSDGSDNENQQGISEYLDQVIYRVDEDLTQMWSSSPAEWVQEYWEVVALMGVIVLILCCCLAYVCCVLPCSGGGKNRRDDYGDPHSGGRVVATASEMEKYHKQQHRQKKGGFFRRKSKDNGDTDTVNDDDGEWDSPFVRMEDGQEGTKTDIERNASEYTDGAISPREEVLANRRKKVRSRRSGSKQGSSIWTEIVDVWSEFLGFKNTSYNIKVRVDDDVAHATTEEDEPDVDIKSSRSSAGRKSSSRRKGMSSDKEDSLLSEAEQPITIKDAEA